MGAPQFETLELRRAQWLDDGDPAQHDYELSEWTEVPYLFANGVRLARVVWHEDDNGTPDLPRADAITTGQYVLLELGDHLGSTSVVLDRATGELVERSTFYAYGATESDYRPERWKGFREDYRFTGKEEDVEVGLTYFGKRYLNPLLGRWVSADPLAVHVPGEADLNLYAYVSGQALRAIDPLGLAEDAAQGVSFDPNQSTAGGEGDPSGNTNVVTVPEVTVYGDVPSSASGTSGGGGTGPNADRIVAEAQAMEFPQYSPETTYDVRAPQNAADFGGGTEAASGTGEPLSVPEGPVIATIQKTYTDARGTRQPTGYLAEAGVPTPAKLGTELGKREIARTMARAQARGSLKKPPTTSSSPGRAKPKPASRAPEHHIATNKNKKGTVRGGPWTPRFERLFKRAGMDLNDALNRVRVPGHKGPHPEAYHRAVHDRLVAATEDFRPGTEAYREGLRRELASVRSEAATSGTMLNRLLTGRAP